MKKVRKKIKISKEVKMIITEVLIFLLSFFVTPIRFYFDIYPFGLALACASSTYMPFALAGSILSVVFFMDASIPYLVAFIGIFALRLAFSFIHRKEEREKIVLGEKQQRSFFDGIFCENIFLRVIVSSLSGFGIKLYDVIVNSYQYYDIFSLVFFTSFISVFTYALALGFKKEKKSTDIMLSSLAVLFVFAYYFSGKEIYGIDLVIVFSYALVLYTSKYISAKHASILGLILGLAQPLPIAPVLSLGGVISGLLWASSPFLAIISSLVIGMGYAIFVSGYEAIVSLSFELLFVSLTMYPLVRFGLLPKIPLIKKDSEENASIEAIFERGKTSELQAQLKNASSSFGGISKMLKDVSKKIKTPTRKYYYTLCLEATEAYCFSCPKREICWKKDTETTERNIRIFTEGVFLKGECTPRLAEEKFLHRCPNIEKITLDITRRARELVKEGIKNDKLEISAKDYELTSRLLSSLSSISEKIEIDRAGSDKVYSLLSKIGLVFDKAELTKCPYVKIVATGIDTVRTSCDGEEIRTSLEKELSLRLTEPKIEAEGKLAHLEIRELPEFELESVFLERGAKKSEPSGDSVAIFDSPLGKKYILLCDGMGSGAEAKLTSKMCVDFLEKILSITNEKELALSMLNNFVRAKSLESSSSVDLFELDAYTLESCFIKSGTAPSYIKRGRDVFKLSSKTAPIGIMKELDAEKLEFKLQRGDFIVMVSDGILPAKSSEAWLSRLLEGLEEQTPHEIAKIIIKNAEEKSKIKDDITVIVALVK